MHGIPSRFVALALTLTAGWGLGRSSTGWTPFFLTQAAAEEISATPAVPAAMDSTLAAEMTHRDSTRRRLAPRDTFYLLDYASAKTDKGVEGFEPGTEVHLVEVHRPTQTLVVTNGRAQVEVSPAQLTNDMDIAALVRQRDQANQVQIAAYMQAEQETYNKAVRDAAEATAKDIADRKVQQRQRLADAREAAEQAKADQQDRQQVVVAGGGNGGNPNGYYNDGGFGYGSPYAYFVNVPAAPAPNPAPAAAPAPPPGNVAAPVPAPPSGPRIK